MYFSEGKNISQIARETGHYRKTIKMYINKENWNQELNKRIERPNCPKLEPLKTTIDSWLTNFRDARKKQRHTNG